MEKVLITGGLGFIFSYVTEDLVLKGYEVVVLDNESEGSHPEIVNETFIHHNVDVDNPHCIELIVNEKPDYIIHAAAYSDVDKSIKSPLAIVSQNVQATMNVFEAARRLPDLKKLVYVSTDEVYGECEQRKSEIDQLFPRNPYSLSKAFGSLQRITYDNTYPELKDRTAETRFCNIFGPRQDERKILPAIKRALDGGKPVPVHEGGSGFREYLYVKNIPPIVEKIMLEGNRKYNVTLNDGFTVKQLIYFVETLTNTKVPTVEATRPGMDQKYQMSAKRIRDLGVKFDYTFKDGMYEYFTI